MASWAMRRVTKTRGRGGTLRGKRTVWGGRARVRGALYMGALTASRHNPVIRVFYQRLLAAGKPKKLALTACMRKLLIRTPCSSIVLPGVPLFLMSLGHSRQLLPFGGDPIVASGREVRYRAALNPVLYLRPLFQPISDCIQEVKPWPCC